MSLHERSTKSSRFGEWLGRYWRRYGRFEKQIAPWLVSKGMPERFAEFVKWLIHLGILLLVFFCALGILMVAALMFMAVRATTREMSVNEDWAIGEQYDERNDPFYDPANNSQIVDPRFDDE